MSLRPAPRWTRVGGSLVHATSKYTVPVHTEALLVGIMPEHVARQPWAKRGDVEELTEEWNRLRALAENRRGKVEKEEQEP